MHNDRFFTCKFCGERYMFYVCRDCTEGDGVWSYVETCPECHNELAHGVLVNVTYRECGGVEHKNDEDD